MGATGTVALARALLHRRLRRVRRDRRACRLRRHGRAARAVRSQVRRVHARDLPRAQVRQPRGAARGAAALLSVPILLALAAEIRMGAFAASALVGASASDAMLLIVLAITGPALLGGMRSATCDPRCAGHRRGSGAPRAGGARAVLANLPIATAQRGGAGRAHPADLFRLRPCRRASRRSPSATRRRSEPWDRAASWWRRSR